MLSRKKNNPSIPTSSMADLAFLLLIFFFVATVIDVDSGLGLTLPEYQSEIYFHSRDRIAGIFINANNEIFFNKTITPLSKLKDELKKRIREKNDLPKNKKLVVSLKADRRTKYANYISLLDQVKLAFYESRNEYARAKYGEMYSELNVEEQNIVKEAIPVIISIAEPEVTE